MCAPVQENRHGAIDDELWQDFLAELTEHLEKIEVACLGLENQPDNTEAIHTLFRSFHTIKGLAGFVARHDIQSLAHETEALLDACRRGDVTITKHCVDLFLSSSDHLSRMAGIRGAAPCEGSIESLVKGLREAMEGKEDKPIGELLVERRTISPDDLSELLIQQQQTGQRIGELAVQEKGVPAREVVEALREQEHVRGEKQKLDNQFIRVTASKVDNLVDMMGELIILHSLLEQDLSRSSGVSSHNSSLNRLTKLTKAMQETALSMRMVAMKSTFQRVARVARDCASNLGKSVNVHVTGNDTEVDRQVADKLLEPMLHLVRNSIAHGIESSEERVRHGKPVSGVINLRAYSRRGYVYIEVADDGRGIDLQKVFQKAVERGAVDPDKSYTREEMVEFIFLPGLSTEEKVNSVSGRGVGMDVVRTEVSRLGGRIACHTEDGRGCAFTLKIPINMAIINATVVEIDEDAFILPTAYVKRILKPTVDQWVSVHGQVRAIRFKDEIIPLLSDTFSGHGAVPGEDLVVVLELDGRSLALPITGVRDRRDMVVKPLGTDFSSLEYVNGASILGDGRVCLILDVEGLFKEAR